MIPDNRWEAVDRMALNRALLELRTCLRCRGPLHPADHNGLDVQGWLVCDPCDQMYSAPWEAKRPTEE